MIQPDIAQDIISSLGLDKDILFLRNVEHFTEKEGTTRDQIVKGYFGSDGLNYLYTELVNALSRNLNDDEVEYLIDLATGTGTFLLPILDRLNLKQAVALDATPKFLEIIQLKAIDKTILTVIGDLEQISLSLKLNRQMRQLDLPPKFDRVMSTLALHHIPKTLDVFAGIADILTYDGRCVIVDMIFEENPDKDWVPDPTHAHHGFRMNAIAQQAEKYFETVEIRELAIKCVDMDCDSRGSGLFLMTLEKPRKV